MSSALSELQILEGVPDDQDHPISRVTVVVPVFNEKDNISAFMHRLDDANAASGRRRTLYVLFINDGSTDGSGQVLDGLSMRRPDVGVVHFSRNFGHQSAVTAGMDLAQGDAVVLIDADLQDPPELIPTMLDELESGYDIVYGQRSKREAETLFKRASAAAFYRIIQRMTDVTIPADAGDFRVMRIGVARVLRAMRERHRFIRGMLAWTGFRTKPFLYVRHARHAGVTKYPFTKMVRFAANAIFSFSNLPLKLATMVGLVTTGFGLAGIFYILLMLIAFRVYLPGVSATLFAVLLMGGIQLIFLGVLGEYVGRLFEASKNRPLYVIARSRNVLIPWSSTPPRSHSSAAKT